MAIVSAVTLSLPLACSAGADGGDFERDTTSSGGQASTNAPASPDNTGGLHVTLSDAGSVEADSGYIDTRMPDDFTPTDSGGFKLVGPVEAAGGASSVSTDGGRQNPCGSTLTGIVRDFEGSAHSDFESAITQLQTGLVRDTIGADRNPVLSDAYASGAIASPESFAQWYEDVPGVNLPYYLMLHLEPNGGQYTFASSAFFPLDGEGFGNGYLEHNYHFTFELHTRFRYRGGEIFQFTGDDDLWVFVNGVLAIDLGGVHGRLGQELNLDAEAARLGIVAGNEYLLDLFHAERHCCESNFQIDTTLEFIDCGEVPPVLR